MKPEAPSRQVQQADQWCATFMVLDVSSTITSSQWQRLVAWATRLLRRPRRGLHGLTRE
jgi:hypothetical protein